MSLCRVPVRAWVLVSDSRTGVLELFVDCVDDVLVVSSLGLQCLMKVFLNCELPNLRKCGKLTDLEFDFALLCSRFLNIPARLLQCNGRSYAEVRASRRRCCRGKRFFYFAAMVISAVKNEVLIFAINFLFFSFLFKLRS